jgi:hypothetical protein
MASSLRTMFESLDLHPKLVSDFAVRTKAGGFVSIGAITVAVLLFVAELRLYRTLERIEHMEVDDMRGSHMKMRLNFDVTFPDMPCAMVSLDALDASGSHSLDVLHNVFKKRLDPSGAAIGVSERDNVKTLKNAGELLAEKQKAIAEGRHVETGPGSPSDPTVCADCFGAGAAGECCNTCESVREAYRKKGWQFNMKDVEQCSREGFYGDVTAQLAANEGCNVYGYLEVPKVPGNVHFAPGHGLQQAYAHTHDLLSFTHANFNISHRINSISFGPFYPGAHYPLDGLTRALPEGSGMHQYFLKLVPTMYQHSGGCVRSCAPTAPLSPPLTTPPHPQRHNGGVPV